MCKLCEKYSEPGVKWYLNPKAFTPQIGEQARVHFRMFHQEKGRLALAAINDAKDAMSKAPLIGNAYFDYVKETWPEGGQIVPLQDALKIVEMADNFAAFPCACRWMAGFEKEETMTCLHFGLATDFYAEILPNGKNIVRFNKEETKTKVIEWNKQGCYHNVIAFANPDIYVYNLCNCPAPYCVAWKWRVVYGETAYMKAEYVARVDPELCTYCGTCAARCPFSAVIMDRLKKVALIDIRNCAGCGLCETGCPKKAIELLDRRETPARDLW